MADADEDLPFGLNAPCTSQFHGNIHEGMEDESTVISSASGPDGMNPLGITSMPPPMSPPGATPNPPFMASRYQPSPAELNPELERRPSSPEIEKNGDHSTSYVPFDFGAAQVPSHKNNSKMRLQEIDEGSSEGGKGGSKYTGMKIVLIVAFIVLAGGGAAVGVVLSKNDSGTNGIDPNLGLPGGGGSPTSSPVFTGGIPTSSTLAPFRVPPGIPSQSTLGSVLQRGVLRCGVSPDTRGFSVFDETTGQSVGFDADLCRAVAATVFGEEGRVEFVGISLFDRFISLADRRVDIVARTSTHTMERNLYESTTGLGFTFSVPYLYNGLQFAGLPPYVECADNFSTADECANTKICALDSSTHIALIRSRNPDLAITLVLRSSDLYLQFSKGFCNVIAGEQFDVAESAGREQGYRGSIEIGRKVHSKEPLALVTRGDDPEWSDIVNWVIQALLAADEARIFSRTANSIGTASDAFGSFFQDGFRSAIAAVGNYGEIYNRHLLSILPRPDQNRINTGTSGLIYSFPFGLIDPDDGEFGPGPVLGGSLEAISARGRLLCGVFRRPVFAEYNFDAATWYGFDVDFCNAVGAAIFGSNPPVEYVDVLSIDEGFDLLQSGDIDVLAGVSLDLQSDAHNVQDVSARAGFSFSQPTFYGGLTFGGVPPYAGCADRLEINSDECRNMTICVVEGTEHEKRLMELYPERFVLPRDSLLASYEGLISKDCDVLGGDVTELSLFQLREQGYSGEYQLGANRYMKDPLALATRQDDVQFSQFVYWIVSAIFYAEEEGITLATAEEMPLVRLFGSRFSYIFRDAIGAVGSYDEIYSRNINDIFPRGGPNLVNALLDGPQHYPYPGVVEP